MEQENFSVIENKTIGRNISMYRKIRGMKASDVAERLGMKEASYTRYERGEGQITVDLIQQVSEVFNVDPMTLLSVSPTNFIESSSHFAMRDYYNQQNANDQQMQAMTKILENMSILTEKLIALLDKKEK